jgi:hypothetical protein
MSTSLNLFTSLIVAVISALITASLSLRRFRREKWWERKVDAYSKVIEALHNSKAFASHHLKALGRDEDVPEETDNELRRRANLAHDEILKTMDVGALLLSKEALVRIKQYKKDAEEIPLELSWPDALREDWAINDKCFKDLIEIARKDLKIK